MLSLDLATDLLDAIGPNTHVLLVGDPDQLPPVGAGKVLDDLIETGVVPRTHLNKVFRQAAQSMVIINARLLNSGAQIFYRHADAEAALQRTMINDFFWFGKKPNKDIVAKHGEEAARQQLAIDIRDEVLDLVCNRIPRTFKNPDGSRMDPRRDIMVLAPMRKGPVGLDILNKELEALLNADRDGKPKKPIVPNRGISVGCRVVQHKNDYNHEIMNGELAIVKDYNDDDKEALLSLDDGDREVWVPTADMDTFHLAWAMSVHKSQGSEFACVVAPMSLSFWTDAEARPGVHGRSPALSGCASWSASVGRWDGQSPIRRTASATAR